MQESKLKLERDELVPPDWLDDFAREEFSRVVLEAGMINILDNLDLAVLAIYANAYSHYVTLTLKIAAEGYTHRRETTTDTYEVVSPYVLAQEKYIKQIMTCSTRLGLATTDRLKLVVPMAEEEPENKFLRLIK